MVKEYYLEVNVEMAPEEKKGQLTLSWTAPKVLLTTGLFVVLALVSECFIVSFFAYSGLTETAAYPLSISPLFHLLPLAVILVLVLSWIYLIKNVATRPYRISTVKVSENRRRRLRRARSKSAQSFLDQIKKAFIKIKDTVFSSGRGSFVQGRLSFGNVASESMLIVLTIFLISAILLAVLVYPTLFTEFAAGLYGTNMALNNFMLGVSKTLQGIIEALGPINDALRAIAPGFRTFIEGIVSPTTTHLVSGDILWRYVFCQNAAAWISAISALAYVRYFCKTYHGR